MDIWHFNLKKKRHKIIDIILKHNVSHVWQAVVLDVTEYMWCVELKNDKYTIVYMTPSEIFYCCCFTILEK